MFHLKWNKAWRQAGQNLVEAAVVMPVLILIIFGVAEVGNALNAKIGVTNAAREGARLAARGNIYSDGQVLQVITQQTQNLDIVANGTVLMTVVRSDPATGFVSYTTTTLVGTEPSRFNSTGFATLYQQATSTSNSAFLRKERFVIIEVIYNTPTLTRIIWQTLPVYAYTVMQISAPS